MDLLGGDQFASQRTDGAGVDLDIGPAGQFADLAGVLFGELQRHVAGYGRYADDLQFRTAKRQQNRDGVVLAGIGVDDDLAWLGHFNSLFGWPSAHRTGPAPERRQPAAKLLNRLTGDGSGLRASPSARRFK